MSDLQNHFIYDEIRRLEHERSNLARLHRQHWIMEEAARSRSHRRVAVA